MEEKSISHAMLLLSYILKLCYGSYGMNKIDDKEKHLEKFFRIIYLFLAELPINRAGNSIIQSFDLSTRERTGSK